MTISRTVSGVLGTCWVCLANATHIEAPYSVALRCRVSGVLGLSTRTRMRICFKGGKVAKGFFHASFEQPNTPNTLNNNCFDPLNLLGLDCVGYVLSYAKSVLALLKGALR